MAEVQNEVNSLLTFANNRGMTLLCVSFRKINSVVLGAFPHQTEMKDRQATGFVRKGTDLIRLGAKLAEEPLEQTDRT